MRSKISILVSMVAVPLLAAQSTSGVLIQAVLDNDLPGIRHYIQFKGDVNARGDRATTPLMYAAAYGTLDAMRMLIAAGADVNAKNAFDATALMWCISDAAKVKLLVSKGADVNAVSKGKRTPALLAALHEGTDSTIALLAAKGARVDVTDSLGMNVPIAGAGAGNLAAVRWAIEKHVDVNARMMDGTTALMNAAGDGNLPAVKMLLAAGADVNAVSADSLEKVKNGTIALGRFTPLLLATSYGPSPLVKTLLDAGAKTDAVDMRHMTALHFALSSEAQDGETVRMLLAKGLDPHAKMETGETAGDWAHKFGKPEMARLFDPRAAAPSAAAGPGDSSASEAAQKGMGLLEKTSVSFFKEGGCVSCHHQNITSMTAAVARAQGLSVDAHAASERLAAVKSQWTPAVDNLLLRQDPPGGFDTIMYSLLAMAGEGYKPDLITAALTRNIAANQRRDGGWHSGGIARPPIQDSDISRTALAIRCMKLFTTGGTKAEYDERIARAGKWLVAAKPVFGECLNMRLVGMKWAGVNSSAVQKAAHELLAAQRSSGGWAQNSSLTEDAYATGQALYALHEGGGIAATDPAYRRGVDYLLKTQMADGSWHVFSRSAKFQPYFQSGFPHDHDQWISAAATGWATMALAFTVERQTGQ